MDKIQERKENKITKCNYCRVETGGADCCFQCLLKTSKKARIIFEVIK